MSYLVLVRHGKSEWNEKGLWTGWADIPLAEAGRIEARKTGEQLRDINFDYAYTSDLIRAKQTLEEILKVLNQSPEIISNKALNERNYGDYTGKNKWDVQKVVGEEEFIKIRRSFDYPLPNGESLKMVYLRAVPYFEQEIMPKLTEQKNIIISAHGNSLRALVKYLENISDTDISKLEIGTGEAYVYEIDSSGRISNKQVRGENKDKLNV